MKTGSAIAVEMGALFLDVLVFWRHYPFPEMPSADPQEDGNL
jgi:hypothetical protein